MVSRVEMWEWAERHPEVMRWLNRLAPSTRRNYLRYCYLFFGWLRGRPGFESSTLKGLLEEQRVQRGYRQLDALQDYIGTLRGRKKWKETVYTAVRSFYAHNRAELPRDRGFRIRGDQGPVVARLTMEGVRSIISSMPLRYRAAFLCMWMGGMGECEFVRWNREGWPATKRQLDSDARLIRVDIPRRKTNDMPYYTFLGLEAIKALREYLEKERGTIKDGEAIFLNKSGRPLTEKTIRDEFKYGARRVGLVDRFAPACSRCGGALRWRRDWRPPFPTLYICLSCGLETPAGKVMTREKRARIRYGVSPHEMRDVWKSEWHRSGADLMVADFMMGHTIDPLGYDKVMKLHPEYAEEQYLKAEPYLSISRPVDTREAVATLEERYKADLRRFRMQLLRAIQLMLEGRRSPEDIEKMLEET